MARPSCRCCGKPLKKFTRTLEKRDEPRVGMFLMSGEPILEVRKPRYFLESMPRYSVWTGQYGYGGDGYFCDRDCGYAFAVKVCRRAEGQHGSAE
jgi:hypothetical protein